MSKIKKGPEGKMQDYLEVLTGDRPKDSPELKAQKGGQIPKPGRGNLDPRSPMGKILNSSAARATRRGVQGTKEWTAKTFAENLKGAKALGTKGAQMGSMFGKTIGKLGITGSIFQAADYASWRKEQDRRKKAGYGPNEGGGLL